MKQEDLFDAIGNADEELLKRSEMAAAQKRPGTKYRQRKTLWFAAGVPAVIGMVLIGTLALSISGNIRSDETSAARTLQNSETGFLSATCPNLNSYESLEEVLGSTDEYLQLTVAQMEERLLPWTKEHMEQAELMVSSAQDGLVVLNDGTITSYSSYTSTYSNEDAITLAASLQDALNHLNGSEEALLLEAGVLRGQRTLAEEENYSGNDGPELLIQCSYDLAVSYQVADRDAMTVEERNRRLDSMSSAVETYLVLQRDSALFLKTKEQVISDLNAIAQKQSDNEMIFTVDEEKSRFEILCRSLYGPDLGSRFTSVTVEEEDGTQTVITSDISLMKVFVALKSVEVRTISGYEGLEREVMLRFWLDDMECVLDKEFLQIGTNLYLMNGLSSWEQLYEVLTHAAEIVK